MKGYFLYGIFSMLSCVFTVLASFWLSVFGNITFSVLTLWPGHSSSINLPTLSIPHFLTCVCVHPFRFLFRVATVGCTLPFPSFADMLESEYLLGSCLCICICFQN